MTTKQTIGFIGVGNMGRPMATHLVKQGHDVLIHDVSAEARRAMVAVGARAAGSAREVADAAEVVFTSLPSPAVYAEVLLGPEGVRAGKATRIAIDLSTVGPRSARTVSAGLRERGMVLIDAPVSGGPAGAQAATLAVMASGPAEAIEATRPHLEVFGKLFVVGPEAGQAQLLKLLNNMLSSTALAITAEAYVAGMKGGLDPRVMLEVINAGSGRNSASLEKFPRHVLTRSFDFGFPIAGACKDIGLAVEECEALGVPVWVGSQARQLWNFAKKQGGGADDMTALVKWLETWSGVDPDSVPRAD
jgi:2-hydroxy-3-oxopropionate reductase